MNINPKTTEKIKSKFESHKTQLIAAGSIVAILGGTYYRGKSNGRKQVFKEANRIVEANFAQIDMQNRNKK